MRGMKPRYFFAMTAALMGSVTQAATWDESADPFAYRADFGGDVYGGEPGYDAGMGVDPIYSTPSSYEIAPSYGAAPARGKRHPFFAPHDAYVEYFGNMSISGQSARTELVNAMLTLPVVNPSRAAWAGWHLDVKAAARITWINTSGVDVLDEDDLYTIGLRATLAHAVGRASQFQVGVTPQISTDFDVMTHDNFYWGGYVAFASKVGSSFRYTLGIAYMPDYYRTHALPVLSLQWRYNPAWELRVQASRISTVCVAHDRFHWGPFFQWNSSTWTVNRYGEAHQFRMTNCIAGLGASYDLKLDTGTTISLLGDVGGTFYNTFRVSDRHGKHTTEKYRTHPGVYARLGVQVAF